jgi:hypothetical protein
MNTSFKMMLGGLTAVAAMALPTRARMDRASEPPVDCPQTLPAVPPGPLSEMRARPIRFNKLIAHRDLERVRA